MFWGWRWYSILLLWGVSAVRGCLPLSIFFPDGSIVVPVVSIAHFLRWSNRSSAALDGAIFAARLVRVWPIAVAAVRPVGVDRVARLLVPLDWIHAVTSAISVRIAIPCRVGLHAVVSCSGRSTHTAYRSAHSVAIFKVALAR